MAISAFIGRAGTGKTQACFERIKEIIATCPGEPILYIVPEPATYTIERSLAEFMPEEGFTTVRVVGFNRLAYQVFQSVGKVRETTLSDVGQKLLLRLIMKRHSGSLELLGQAARQPHFADVLQGLLSECNSFKVTATDLRQGAEQVESMILQRKLQELAQLMEAYEALVGETCGTVTDRLQELMEVLPSSPLMKDSHVIVDGFHWFTPLQMELLYTLFDLAKESIITLTLPPDLAKLTVPEHKLRIFGRPHSVYKDLYTTYGTELLVRQFTNNERFITPVLKELESCYFNTPLKGNSTDEQIPITAGYNREREADAVCRQILTVMTEPKRRWKDITIMLRESETYSDVLEKALKRYEIPYFSDRRRPMVSHPLGEFLVSVLEVVRRGFDHDALFRLLKTDFWPISREAVDELENYCLEFGVRDFMWLKDEWPYKRKDRFASEDEEIRSVIDDSENIVSIGDEELSHTVSEETVDVEEVRRLRVNETRTLIMRHLQPFWEFAKTEHTGYEWCEQLFNLLTAVGIPVQLAQWCETAEAMGAAETVAAHEQMYKRVVALFDEIMNLNLPDPMNVGDMELLVQEGLEEVSYSLVPPSLDHVMVTTVERGYTHESDIVFLMGLNEGVFPQHMGDEGLLNDKERQDLKAAGITLVEGALVRAFNENFLLYLACTRGRNELYLSYAGADEEGGALESALAIKRWQQLGYSQVPQVEPLTISPTAAPQYLWRPMQSLALLAGQMGNVTQGQDLGALWRSLYDWSLKGHYREALRIATRGVTDTNEVPLVDRSVVQALLFRQDALSGSVTRLESYQRCPFAFYAKYGLKLEQRKVKQFGAPEIGIFLHESLRALGMQLLAQNRQWRDVSVEEEAQLCQAVVAEISNDLLLGEAGDIYETVLQQRLEATLRRTVQRLSDWSSKSVFNTRYLEKNFGGGPSSWPAVQIPLDDGNYIRLQGQLDRVDEWTYEGKTYGLVVDYKSGGASVKAADVYYGLKLQLVTYLLALEKAQWTDHIEPAALVYTYVKNPRVSKREVLTEEGAAALLNTESSLRNTGYFLNNPELLMKIDETVGSKTTPYVPVRLTKAGTVNGNDKDKVKTTEQFKILTDYAQQVMGKAGQHILAGHFPVSPYNMNHSIPCNYCQYQALCRFENTRNAYRYLEGMAEESCLARMAEGGDVYEVDKGTRTSN